MKKARKKSQKENAKGKDSLLLNKTSEKNDEAEGRRNKGLPGSKMGQHYVSPVQEAKRDRSLWLALGLAQGVHDLDSDWPAYFMYTVQCICTWASSQWPLWLVQAGPGWPKLAPRETDNLAPDDGDPDTDSSARVWNASSAYL